MSLIVIVMPFMHPSLFCPQENTSAENTVKMCIEAYFLHQQKDEGQHRGDTGDRSSFPGSSSRWPVRTRRSSLDRSALHHNSCWLDLVKEHDLNNSSQSRKCLFCLFSSAQTGHHLLYLSRGDTIVVWQLSHPLTPPWRQTVSVSASRLGIRGSA